MLMKNSRVAFTDLNFLNLKIQKSGYLFQIVDKKSWKYSTLTKRIQ